MLCLSNTALYLYVLWEDVIDCPDIVRKDAVAYPRILFRGGGGGSSTNSVEDRGQRTGIGVGSSLVRGSGGNCNLVQ